MKLAVVGSRGWTDRALIARVLHILKPSMIISGGADGVDTFAVEWAKAHGVETKVFLPDWSSYGKSAGARRNRAIVQECDRLIAFWDGRSKGTKISIDMAEEQNKLESIIFGPTAAEK